MCTPFYLEYSSQFWTVKDLSLGSLSATLRHDLFSFMCASHLLSTLIFFWFINTIFKLILSVDQPVFGIGSMCWKCSGFHAIYLSKTFLTCQLGTHIGIGCLKEKHQLEHEKKIGGALIASSSPAFPQSLHCQLASVSTSLDPSLKPIDVLPLMIRVSPHIGQFFGGSGFCFFI